jgi:hypothetical protein
MKTGYSLLLREYLEASEVDYSDCESFQITCPACHEAVFKAGTEGGRQYLSHYPAASSNVPDCELRVASTSRTLMDEQNKIARGQHLKNFLSVFHDVATRHFFKDWGRQRALDRLAYMKGRPAYRQYVRTVREACRISRMPDATFGEDSVAETYPQMSPFWRRRQSSFGRDFLEHLSSAQAFQNFMTATSIGLIHQYGVAEKHGATGPEADFAVQTMKLLIEGTDRQLVEFFTEFPPGGGPAARGKNTALAAMVPTVGVQAVTAVLFEFPYVETLRTAARRPAR